MLAISKPASAVEVAMYLATLPKPGQLSWRPNRYRSFWDSDTGERVA